MILKLSTFIHALLLSLAISFSAATTADTKEIVLGSDLNAYTFKPQDVIYPGFVQGEQQRRSNRSGGLPGFVNDIRNFVRSSVGAPRTDRFRGTTPEGRGSDGGSAGIPYEPPFPIPVGQNTRRAGWAEITLGFSIREILLQIFSIGTTNTEFAIRRGGRSSGNSQTDWFGNWFGNQYSNEFDDPFQPFPRTRFHTDPTLSLYPANTENSPLVSSKPTHGGDMDGVIALRKKVLELFFNPFVFFSLLILLIYLFMSRFRSSTA